MEDVWVPIFLFVAIAVVISLWLHFRHRSRVALQQTVRAAIDKGQDLSPELLDRLGQPRSSGYIDLRRGVISIGLGVAIAVFVFALGDEEAVRPLLAISAFPFMLGVTYLALWRFVGNKDLQHP